MTTPAADTQREMLSLVTARIRDAYLRKPHYVDGGTDLVAVCRDLSAHALTYALVRDMHEGRPRLGIFTTTDLRDALLRPVPPQQLAVREVAHFDLVSIGVDADLFEALWLMVRHRVHRLVVLEGDAVLGVLSQLDLVSFVSNHSHIVALQIDDATSLADLRAAARRVDEMIKLLHGAGIRIERITRLVSELNTRLFSRLWALLAPPEVVANTCLVVMGSEGRGEQILKTDQDNALLLRDGFEWPGLGALTTEFNAALAELGYPPCPGDIMLTNPRWCQPLAAFRQTIYSWMYGADGGPVPDGPMHLAIFFDAVAVAGDASLLEQARAYLERVLSGDDALLARFAAAADQFQEPGHWFKRLTTRRNEQPLDLKKLGTFPIVHGVRALSLQYGVRERSTAARLAQLVVQQRIDAGLASDLVDALQLLMSIRLTHQLQQREQGLAASNEVRPSDLSTLEREPLHDALAIVRRFRQFLRQHFRTETL
ncbi:MAG: putative nucleotidyltransferase substrate binding domain-containing protein [Rubrivivax sp.]|nr:putative nucleotidyltransferase substrate binding domain-containing protein [Rubrivivax sp.]